VSVSTRTLVPGAATPAAPGTGACAEPTTCEPTTGSTIRYVLPSIGVRPSIGVPADELAWRRAATDPDVHAWLRHIRPAAGCAHPIRLAGTIHTVDADTGRVASTTATADLPDGVIYKPCGNRRTAVCPSCADTYRRDAYQLVRAGLVGGKGIPATVAAHPALFVTLTAPSFGLVHTRRTGKGGQQLACRPRRHAEPCPHGVDLRCGRIHAADERTLGQPRCLDCYDHDTHVIWNNQAPELWRRTTIAITRAIRRRCRQLRIPARLVRLSFGKVAEMQRRGVVHYHAIIRLDGRDPADPDIITRPPAGLDVLDLADAVHRATATAFTTEPHLARPGGWAIGWGEQVDIRPLRLGGDNEITDGMVAGYLAKYATKSTEATGHVSRRLTDETIDLHADPDGSHTERLVDACWTLGRPRDWRGLRRWAHMLGFGGHFLTKSRRYSITFRILRQRRVIHARTEAAQLAEQHTDETTVLVTNLAYAGAGWRTAGDALLANTSAAMARERQRAAREALADEINTTWHHNTPAVAA
jgi:hypothetical protein